MNSQDSKNSPDSPTNKIRVRRQSGFFLDAELEKAFYRLEERGLVESVNDDEYEITFRRKSA